MRYSRVGWKYVLDEPYRCRLGFDVSIRWHSRYCDIRRGRLLVHTGYAWDGPSGPTLDTDNAMRAALVHDVLYQAIREGGLPRKYRRQADREFRRLLKADGMTLLRRWAWWLAVRLFGAKHVDP